MISTRRAFILGIALAVLIAATVGLMLGRRSVPRTPPPETSSISTAPSPQAAPTSDTSSPSPTSSEPDVRTRGRTPSSDTDEAKNHGVPTVEGFARNFTNARGGHRTWLNRLQPYVTVEVRQYLATGDMANVPAGRYREYEVLQPGESQLAVRVIYRDGWSMVLYLVSDGTEWRVFRYDRFEE